MKEARFTFILCVFMVGLAFAASQTIYFTEDVYINAENDTIGIIERMKYGDEKYRLTIYKVPGIETIAQTKGSDYMELYKIAKGEE